MIYYYTLFTIFSIVVVMITIDPNVGDYIVLYSAITKNKVKGFYWMLRFHPIVFSSPIGKWFLMKKYMRTAKKLAQELSKNSKDAV